MIAVYYETLLRNVKTGWAKFTVIPKELCRTKDGLMTCEGIIGIYVQGMPIEITGVEKMVFLLLKRQDFQIILKKVSDLFLVQSLALSCLKSR